MYTMTLELGQDKETTSLELEWKIGNSFLALLWTKGFARLSQQKKSLYPRPTGFLSPLKNWDWLRAELHQAIQMINKDGRYRIEETGFEEFNQDFSNRIHHHFEILIGPIENRADYYNQSSFNVTRAVVKLNHIIHDMEALDRSEKAAKDGDLYSAALITECMLPPRTVIPKECYGEFNLNTQFGDLFLHYSQIGKTWWEVFLDKDETIFPEAIRPLNYVSGEFDIFFQDFEPSGQMIGDLNQFLTQNGQSSNDPALRLGYVSVGQLENQNFSKPDVLKKVCENLIYNRAKLYRGKDLIAEIPADWKFYSYLEVDAHV